jgi:hypothetical protein
VFRLGAVAFRLGSRSVPARSRSVPARSRNNPARKPEDYDPEPRRFGSDYLAQFGIDTQRAGETVRSPATLAFRTVKAQLTRRREVGSKHDWDAFFSCTIFVVPLVS